MNILCEKKLIYCSVLVLFGLYYLFYFLPFDNGQISGNYSLLFLSLKLFGLLLLIAGFKSHFEIRTWSLLLFLGYAASFTLLSIRWLSGWALEDKLFANLYLQIPIILFVVKGVGNDGVKRFWKALAIFMVLQVVLEMAFRVLEISLWTEHRSAGGVGNPTSFGLFCLISIIYLCHTRKLAPTQLAAIIVLQWGILLSGSLAAYLCMYGVFILGAALEFRRWKTYISLLAATPINEYFFKTLRTSFTGVDLSHITRKFTALSNLSQQVLLPEDMPNAAVKSASISERINQHLFFIESALRDWSLALLGGLDRHAYWKADSQYLTYFASYGILFGLFFAGFNLYALKKALQLKSVDNGFSFSLLFFLNLAFLASRVLDYFPMATIYFILLGTIFCNTSCGGPEFRPYNSTFNRFRMKLSPLK